jgi:hypothetical protein
MIRQRVAQNLMTLNAKLVDGSQEKGWKFFIFIF